jgi:hypothetical protein
MQIGDAVNSIISHGINSGICSVQAGNELIFRVFYLLRAVHKMDNLKVGVTDKERG